MTAADWQPAQHDDLVDRLAAHDIRYLQGGTPRARTAAPLVPLINDLVRAPGGRLRGALVALLLRHPEYAQIAETVANGT